MQIGNRNFDLNRQAYLMGILNVTPDSFSDGGKFAQLDAALYHAQQMVDDGADILDIGGESTRPGHQEVTAAEEMERVLPIVEAVKSRFDLPVSLDTYKAEVAIAGAGAGADMINDVWGFQRDPAMAAAAAKLALPVCLMHNRKEAVYVKYMEEVLLDLQTSISLAVEAGVAKDRILVDPGIGFAKDLNQNLYLMNHLEQLSILGCPILLGTSRKSMIGLTLDLPVEEREEGTLTTTVIGRMKGASVFRVHDVKANKRALQMTNAILEKGELWTRL